MYKVYFDGEAAYFPGSRDHELISPRVSLEVNKSGSFTFKIYPSNPAYDSLKEMVTEVRVTKNDTDIFRGRVIDIVTDFDNAKSVTCEGELAYLLDTIQEPAEYHGVTVRGFLEKLVAKHNSQVTGKPGIDKTFTVGQVTVTDLNDSLYRYTNWETTLDDIKDKLIGRLGGYLQVRKENGKRYLDYIADFSHVTEQTIDFGYNLLDYSKTLDATDIATAVIPLGERLEDSDIEALDAYLTVASVNAGSVFVYLPEAVQTYGWICKVINFDDVTVPANLKTKAQQYLTSSQFASLVLELNALDLSLLDTDIEELALGDYVFCRSKVHGLNERILISKRVYNLAEPEEDTVTLGTAVPAGIAERTSKPGTAFITKIKEQFPSTHLILEEAKQNATEIINAATHGYVVTTADEQLIMDTNDVQTATKLWRWNLNGLAYSKNGYAGPYELAITLDGSIVADFITAGILNADIIRAGRIADLMGNNYWDLETGEFKLSWTGAKIGSETFVDAIENKIDENLAGVIETIEQIGEQVDGKAETWYQTSDPSTAWTTAALKNQHKGDLWYNSTSSVQKYYRWSGTAWQELTANPPKAVFDTIDGKAQVFTSTPTVPYYVGDLWFNSSTSDIMTCITQRTSGSYTASDWVKRNKYTDDTTANSAKNRASAKYGTSSTAAGTVAKVVSLSNFELFTGARISVKFTYANTAASPTLNVNSTGAKAIYAKGTTIAAKYYWTAGSMVNFTYDGTRWVMEAEDQTEIFNRLTNNGETQGIYLSNGKLYINATYIATGTLADSGSNTTFNLSTGALTMKKGSINIGSGAFQVTTAGALTATNATITGNITSKSGNEWMKISESVMTGGYSSTTHGLLDLSAQTASGSSTIYDVVLEAKKYNLRLKAPSGKFIYVNQKGYDYPAVGTSGSDNTGRILALYRVTSSGTTYLGVTNFSNNTLFCTMTSSDARLKEDIKDSIVDALSVINAIEHKSFRYKSGGERANGYIAQQLETLEDNFVFEAPQNDGSTIKQVNTFEVLTYATKAIQELSAKVEALEERIKVLEGQLEGGK
ncbi:MAG: hypothetical protein E7244_27990 [Enterocloster citroniae]|nr:hypothetical protein [Enterocloster citroniae]